MEVARGDELVLLGGMNCSALLWSRVLDDLPDDAAGAVHRPDLDADSVDGCVDDLLAALPQRFALAGLSLGGIVAMRLVHRAPDRVSRLCLLSTNGRGPSPEQDHGWRVALDRLAAGASARDLQRDLLGVLLAEPARSAELDDLALRMGDECGRDRLERQLRAQRSRRDERPGLASITAPTTVIAGGLDALCPPARHTEIVDLVPGSRLVELERVGHLSPLEAPRRVARALREWLA